MMMSQWELWRYDGEGYRLDLCNFLFCCCPQFCEIISAPQISRWAGPIIDVLLDYVGNVQLCARLTEHLDSYEDWEEIKEKSGKLTEMAQ